VQHFDPLIEALEPLLVKKLTTSEHTMAFQLAISLWSFATLGHYRSAIFFSLLLRSLELAHRFKPLDVAHVLWACGVTSHTRSHFVLSSLLVTIEPRLSEFQGRELAAMAWGMSRVNVTNNTVLLHAAERIIKAPGGLRSREIVTLLYSFTRIRFTGIRETGVHAAALHELVTPPRLAALNPQDVAMAVWAMARIKAEVPIDEVEALAARAVELVPVMNHGEMAVTAYGFAMLGCRPKTLLCKLADRTLHLRRTMRCCHNPLPFENPVLRSIVYKLLYSSPRMCTLGWLPGVWFRMELQGGGDSGERLCGALRRAETLFCVLTSGLCTCDGAWGMS
jgi:hypothetical protein